MGTTAVPALASARIRFGIRRAVRWLAVLAAVAMTAVAGYLRSDG